MRGPVQALPYAELFVSRVEFCKDCNRFFKSEECFNRHKDDTGPAKSLCRALVKCEKCQRVVTRASINDHYCGKVRCSTFQMYVRPENHKCFLQPVKTRKGTSEEEESHTNFLDNDVAENVQQKC